VTQQTDVAPTARHAHPTSPWPALFALCLGFFMILVDSTIVSVATPALIEHLHAGVNSVIWVTSAYLLAYAVPVLITGRLGDRIGPRNVYLVGLAVFTLSSLWCGLTGSIGMLILARVFQGLGASMMTPQTMAIITRIFPAARRGAAMSLWGATAGVATLVGPLLGGVLVDGLGWQWIFFVNVPVGAVAFALAMRLVPRLETHEHRFDWLGVALSGVGMFLLVFGIQEGHQYHWSTITGVITVWRLIVLGLVVLAAFVFWQARNRREPLVPLSLFRDRNFSLANVAITAMGFAVIAMGFPFMLYAQLVRGLSPTGAALLMVPMAVTTMVLAPFVGKLTDAFHPRWLTSFGFVCTALSLWWLAMVMTPSSPTWQVLLPMVLLGLGNAFVWSPNSATATRNLPMHRAGAGAGVYNATRQVGSVLGSAAIAVLMDSRIAAHGLHFEPSEAAGSGHLPAQVVSAFSGAMSDSMLLPAGILLAGLVAVLFFTRPVHQRRAAVTGEAVPAAGPVVAQAGAQPTD
jgi:EmrB/QacA subfamily drug resistance transporter